MKMTFIIIEDKTRKVVKSGYVGELAEYFNCTESAIYNAYKGGYLFKGKYRVGAQKGAIYEIFDRCN